MINKKLWLPPAMRFLVELTTWIWLFVYNWFILPVSLLSLALLNFPGDKKSVEEKGIGLMVPGTIRVLIEISSAGLGIFVASELFGLNGLIFQLSITMTSFYLDLDRWLWMLGKSKVPQYVTHLHQ